MTFAALLVTQKRERRKVSLCISRANNVRPYHPKPEFHQQTKEKSDTPSAFSFAKSGAKEKVIKKKSADGETSRSAERDHRCRWTPPPFEKGGRKLYYGARKLFMGENFCATSKILTAVKSNSAKTKALPFAKATLSFYCFCSSAYFFGLSPVSFLKI